MKLTYKAEEFELTIESDNVVELKSIANAVALYKKVLAFIYACNDNEPNPDWSLAPDWAKWWAVDENGDAWYYEKKPRIDNGFWEENENVSNIHLEQEKVSLGNIDWKTTLRKRPE